MRYPEDVPTTTTGEQETDETVQPEQPAQTSSDSCYPNPETVREDTNPEQGTLDFNLI